MTPLPNRRFLYLLLILAILMAAVDFAANQSQAPAASQATPKQPSDAVYVCPMDPDVRSNTPGMCERCGMKLAAGVPDPIAFHLDLAVTPQPVKPGQPARITFEVHDPWKNRLVRHFQIVHEKLFHAFVVGPNLEFFEHGHPTLTPGGSFEYPVTFPTAGAYRVLGDFYPDGATPQLITKTVIVPGPAPRPVTLLRDYSGKTAQNLQVSLETLPSDPVAGDRTHMRFTVSPGGLEKYLGAWAHMLAVSDDMIDMVHQHPFAADGSPKVEFSVAFPRPRTYRIWVQFQKDGVINTVRFDVPVKPHIPAPQP